ncbi:hypothetical protein Cflav_PD5364 [Pedosphaera parvula Ellin514]|uniref:DUF5009 domain-containing protein n=1 Tax=Pedosphaera parvula (strain Ellin514) TaxID=320771 RepID=B9XB44_PEDPL|nr:hypothetical protein Cflav_PD5364 [Pedosphaera parvula Ellin514]
MPDLVPSVPRPVVANEITTPKRTSQGRTYALEALRAFAILAMVLSGQLPFDQNSLPARMYHAQEPSLTHGVDLTLPVTTRVDLDFPFLLYSIGPAFPLALTQGTEQGISKVTCSILERGFLLGIFWTLCTNRSAWLEGITAEVEDCGNRGWIGKVSLHSRKPSHTGGIYDSGATRGNTCANAGNRVE